VVGHHGIREDPNAVPVGAVPHDAQELVVVACLVKEHQRLDGTVENVEDERARATAWTRGHAGDNCNGAASAQRISGSHDKTRPHRKIASISIEEPLAVHGNRGLPSSVVAQQNLRTSGLYQLNQ
jgi:hypothetical protein